VSSSLRSLLAAGGTFQGYTYAYPHKTAYRPLQPPQPLRQVWAQEDKRALFLYAHVPFCEMRCGFCNLFTMPRPDSGLVVAFLDALARQAEATAAALGASARFARLAVGGGTPTFLIVPELERLFSILNDTFLDSAKAIPQAIEASPATVDEEKIAFLKAQGITRISLGVQSFVEHEVRALGRTQRLPEVRRALQWLGDAGFACLNVDLIYGIAGQTAESWRRSLAEALEFGPQEIYAYPLYVRPKTQLDQLGRWPTDERLNLYRVGRDFLHSQGYRQVSMRLFRKASYAPAEGPVYCCQEDGMVGLGPGARSYTRALHYSTEYALGRSGVLDIINASSRRTREQFAYADYGCELTVEEQKRRYLLKSLLRCEGLDLAAFESCFCSAVLEDFPQLQELLAEDFARETNAHLQLTPAGLELSDVIGPWLWSAAVCERMNGFVLR
jgi:oxygen-independent coproporphyrinogen III oxidase